MRPLCIAVRGAKLRVLIIAANILNKQLCRDECCFVYTEIGFGRRSNKSALTVTVRYDVKSNLRIVGFLWTDRIETRRKY